MAGRPKTMVKRFEKIEVAGMAVFDQVVMLMPEQYHGIQKNPGDPLSLAWNACFDKALAAVGAQETLGNLLRKKAGITTLGPCDVIEGPPVDGLPVETVAAEGAGGGD